MSAPHARAIPVHCSVAVALRATVYLNTNCRSIVKNCMFCTLCFPCPPEVTAGGCLNDVVHILMFALIFFHFPRAGERAAFGMLLGGCVFMLCLVFVLIPGRRGADDTNADSYF